MLKSHMDINISATILPMNKNIKVFQQSVENVIAICQVDWTKIGQI